MSGATALPTEPQPLPTRVISYFSRKSLLGLSSLTGGVGGGSLPNLIKTKKIVENEVRIR